MKNSQPAVTRSSVKISCLCSQLQCENEPLTPGSTLLIMHKPVELVFVICPGRQPLARTDSDTTAYHHDTSRSLMSTLRPHTKPALWRSRSLFHTAADTHQNKVLSCAVERYRCEVIIWCYEFPQRHWICPLCSPHDSMSMVPHCSP